MKKIIILLLVCANLFAQNKTILGVKSIITTGANSSIDSLDNLLDVIITSPALNQILKYDGTNWVNGTIPGSGTVTSVGAFQPAQGFTISGSPITGAGNFTFTLSDDLLGLENLSSTGIAVRNGTSSWVLRSILAGSGITVNNGDGTLGNITITANDVSSINELQSLFWNSINSTTATATLSTGGGDLIFRAGTNTLFANVSGGLEITATGGGGGSGITSLSMAQPTSGFTISPTTLSSPGTFTFTLNNDLLALENLSSTGIVVRTNTNAFANRIITGSGGITVTNGDGVSGNINISYSGGGGGITGSGSTYFLPVFNTSTSVTNSMFQQDAASGSYAGIGSVSVPGVKLSIGSGDVKIGGLTAGLINRVLFGDGSYAWIGENGIDDRLYIQGSTLSIFVAGTYGSNGQVLTSNGSTASWVTPSGGTTQTLGFSGNSSIINMALTPGNTTNITAGTNISFSSISSSGFTINSTGGGGGTMSMPGSLNYTISGVTGSVQYIAGTNMSIALGGTSTNSTLTFNAANQIQTFSTSGLITTLSSGGSIGFQAGANMTITNVGTSTNPIYNFVSAGGGGGSSTDLSFINAGSNSWLLNNTTGTDVTLNFASGFSTSLAGSTLSINANDVSNTNEAQSISLTSNVITLTSVLGVGGGTVNLSSYLDNTDNQNLGASGNQITLTNSGSINLVATGLATITGSGNTITVGASYSDPDNNNTNEAQTLSFASNVITLSSVLGVGGGTANLSSYLQSFTTSGLIASLSGGVSSSIGVASGTGISISNTGTSSNPVFTITNTNPGTSYTAGTGINISGSVISNTSLNTDNQTLSWSGITTSSATLNVSTGNSVQVLANTAGIQFGTSGGNIVINNVGDLSNSNELQSLSLSGQSLGISSGTGVTLPVINVSSGTGISVNTSSGNFTVTNTGDLSATNEAQSLSIAGSIITLSSVSGVGGGSVTLPAATLNNLTTYQVGETAQRTLFTNSDGTMITFAGSGEFISGYWVYQSFSVESDLLVAYAAFSGSGYIPSYFDSNGSITRPSGYVVGNGGTLLSDAVVVQGIGNFTLPTGVSGKVVYITNTTGSSITISAPSGGSINGLGSYALGANKGAVVFYLSNTVTGIATN